MHADWGFRLKQNDGDAFAHTVVGTPFFMAPEVQHGKPYTFSSGVWSLGVLVYYMCTHEMPFEAESSKELNEKVGKNKIKSNNGRFRVFFVLGVVRSSKATHSPPYRLGDELVAECQHFPQLPVGTPYRAWGLKRLVVLLVIAKIRLALHEALWGMFGVFLGSFWSLVRSFKCFVGSFQSVSHACGPVLTTTIFRLFLLNMLD
jgi:serine/threonine protein kinase